MIVKSMSDLELSVPDELIKLRLCVSSTALPYLYVYTCMVYPHGGGGGLANNFVLLQLYSGYNQYFHQKYLLGTAFQNV